MNDAGETKILKCSCPSEYQDNKYGRLNRVHNPMRKSGYRCTVCGREQAAGDSKKGEK